MEIIKELDMVADFIKKTDGFHSITLFCCDKVPQFACHTDWILQQRDLLKGRSFYWKVKNLGGDAAGTIFVYIPMEKYTLCFVPDSMEDIVTLWKLTRGDE